MEIPSQNHVLDCTSPAERGGIKVKREIYEKYKAFRDYFDESLAGYHPGDNDVDYSDINKGRVPY